MGHQHFPPDAQQWQPMKEKPQHGMSHGSRPSRQRQPLAVSCAWDSGHPPAQPARRKTHAQHRSAAVARENHGLEMAEKHQGVNLLDTALKPEYGLPWTDLKWQGQLLIDKEIRYWSERRWTLKVQINHLVFWLFHLSFEKQRWMTSVEQTMVV